MQTITFAAPAALDGASLAAELAEASGKPAESFQFSLIGDELTVQTPMSVPRAKVAKVVAAHTGTPLPKFQRRHDAKARLRDLADKGWDQLTPSERDEVMQHALALLAT